MNIQKIYEALEEDNRNSALGIICNEFESQGYEVFINDKKNKSEELFHENNNELEQQSREFKISLYKDNKCEQKFAIEFIDFHEFIIKKDQ